MLVHTRAQGIALGQYILKRPVTCFILSHPWGDSDGVRHLCTHSLDYIFALTAVCSYSGDRLPPVFMKVPSSCTF